MNNFLGQLNLTTQERRIVVAIFLVVVVVLNLLFVWPHFGEWGRLKKQLTELYRTEDNYNRTIQLDTDPTNGWKKRVDKMARQQGGSKIDSPVDPQNQLQQTIYQQERKTGVTVGSFSPGAVKTNEYFEEHSTTISFESPEQQLISFLYGMGNDPAMIRVAKLSLQPVEPHRYHLKGSITLTANYTKKDVVPVAAPANQKPNFGPKPAVAAAKKPGVAPDPAQGVKHRSGVAPPGQGQNGPSANNSKTNLGSRKNPLSRLVPGSSQNQ